MYYFSPVDVTSRDDQDNWVVSPNGYNELVTLVRAEPLNDPVLFPEEVDFVNQDGDFGIAGGGSCDRTIVIVADFGNGLL